MPTVRKYRRETSEISCCLKYVIFSVNVFFWVLGLFILVVGVWAWNEKGMFHNLSKFTTIALDPAFILICIGTITFIIGFAGCVGALRENTCLLAIYALFLVGLVILEFSAGLLGYILKDKGWLKEQATDGLRAFIRHYRDDPDQQNLIDWIQEDWLQCCGIEGPKDWDSNNYFNCSSKSVGSREACGVPFSCCKQRFKDKQCGFDARKEGYFKDTMDISSIINDKGCVQAGEEWFERNLIIIASGVIFLFFMQLLGVCLAQNLRADIFAQKAKWH